MNNFLQSHPAASAVQILLLLSVIVIGPPVDLVLARGLKRQPNPATKRRYYRMGIASQWICAALACVSPGWRACFFLHMHAPPLGQAAIRFGGWILLTPIFVGNFRPAVKALNTGSVGPNLANYLRRLSFFLPVTAKRAPMVCRSLCDGKHLGGDTLPRFLFHAIRVWPLELGLTAALLLSSIVFGFNHLDQGLSGVVNTGIAGVLFGLVSLLTGNLALGMVLHTMIDLQVLILLARLPVEEAPHEVGK